MRIIHLLLTTIIFFSSALISEGQTHRLFSSDKDLSSSLINDVFQDSYGMIWIATEDGLNRYDGAKFTVYRRCNDRPNGLAHNFVNSVFEDKDRNLFIGTHNGAQMYNRDDDTFSPPAVFDSNGKSHTGNIKSFFQRDNGEIWIVGNITAPIKSIENGKIKVRHIPESRKLFGFSHQGIEDSAGNIWIIKDEAGLYRIDRSGKIKHYFSNPDSPGLVSVVESPVSGLFFGSYDKGLFRYNYDKDSFEHIADCPGGSIIRDLYADKNGDIYIATDGRGLLKYSRDTRTVSQFYDGLWSLDASVQKVHSVTKDNDGNMWLGIYQKGVELVSNHLNAFNYLGSRSAVNNIIGNSCVTAIHKTGDGRLWIGTDNDGIYIVDKNRQSSKHLSGNGIPEVVLSLFEDSAGRIWVGSIRGEAGYVDQTTGKFTSIPIYDMNGKKVVRIYSYTEDNNGNIWIATMGFGLFRHNVATGQTTQWNHGRKQSIYYIDAIYFSQQSGALYLGTYDGLDIIADPTKNEVKNFEEKSIVFSIREDKAGNIWFATSEGLKMLDPLTEQTVTYTIDNGLPVNTVYSLEACQDDIWASTTKGLARLNRKTGTITNYYIENGLQANEFYKNASLCDDDTLYFGGINGLSYFNPDAVVKPGRKLNVRVTDLYVNGIPVNRNPKLGSIVKGPVYATTQIKIPSPKTPVALEFATCELGNTQSVTYMYSLDGKPWVSLPRESRIVSFSNITAGHHTLDMKVIDNGIESNISRVDLYVSPLWYQSTCAYIVYSILMVVIAFMLWRFIKTRSHMRNQALEREYMRQVNEARMQFFINVSHEIRSPMSLVIAPLQKLISQESDTTRLRCYNLIYRNAKRVLRLVNELMDIRKIEKGQMNLIYKEVQIVQFIDDIYYTYSEAIAAKGISFSFHHEGNDGLKVWIDTSNFDKVIVNLLSNALKYTPSGGSIKIWLSTVRNATGKEMAQISVTDTGCGIPDKEKPHIFERFYQVMNNNAGGSGVGLNLTEALVKLHHGDIEVTDNPEGQGSCFTVRIPLGLPPADTNHVIDNNIKTDGHSLETSLLPDLPSENNTQQLNSTKGTIFIAEDDAEIRNYLKNELSTHYRVIAFENGKLAFDEMFRHKPDLVISDLMMPEMDGLTLAQKIKQNVNLNHIPVILLTAKGRDEDTLEGLRAGADAYISKPFNIEILLTTINNLILVRKNLQNIYSGNQAQKEHLEEIGVISTNEALLSKIMKVINANMDNADFTVEAFAIEVGMSRVHLHRKLKELTNQSPRDFIRNMRLQQASRLLSENKLPISEVAYMVGFKNANHFSVAFKELYGTTPSAYMDSNSIEGS